MNDMISTPSGGKTPATMSSREIAELVEKRHDNVKRTIDSLAASGLVHPQIEDEPETDAMGRTRVTKVYRVGKRDSYVIVAQLSPEFTARLVDRWQELEAKQQRPDPMVALNDPATMRGLLLSYSEKMLELEAANAELAPKANALDRIATADGSLCVTDAAKALQMRPKDLFTYLQSHGWIYRRAGGSGYLGYQPKVMTGLLEHKMTTVLRADGSEKVAEQVRITAKGLAKLAALFPPPAKAA